MNNMITKIHPVAFGISLGLVWGLSLFFMGQHLSHHYQLYILVMALE